MTQSPIHSFRACSHSNDSRLPESPAIQNLYRSRSPTSGWSTTHQQSRSAPTYAQAARKALSVIRREAYSRDQSRQPKREPGPFTAARRVLSAFSFKEGTQ
jgi:hypothetical protein